MRPRQGEALAASVLRPLAEQLVAALRVHRGAVVCELMCDGGVLTRSLAPVIGAAGTLVAVDTDSVLAHAAAGSVASLCTARAAVGDGAHIPLDERCCDAVASLVNVVFADAAALFQDARRVLRSGATAAVLVWDADDPPAHEAALDAALRGAGVTSAFMQRLLAPVAVPDGATQTVVRDVVRLDTIAHLWAAVTDRPVGAELVALPPATVAAVRRAYEEALSAYRAPDATLRIPISARLITLTG